MNDPSTQSTLGDVLHGKNNFNKPGSLPHYIIFLGPTGDPDLFYGAMLTHSPGFGNIALQNDHFETNDSSGRSWKVVYHNSYIANDLLAKGEKARHNSGSLTGSGCGYWLKLFI